MLRNLDGEWIDDELQLKEMVSQYFQNLFTKEGVGSLWPHTRYSFPRIAQADLDLLSREMDTAKIRKALFGMNAWKASGPDGFPTDFY